MELRRREASPHASASHGTRPACATGRGARCLLLPVEGPMQKSRTTEECCVHSFCATGLAQRHRRCELVGRARRRSFCSRCTQLVPQASLQVAEGACTHAMLAHHTVLTCVLTSCARRRWKGSAAHIRWISLTVHAVGSCIGWRSIWCAIICNKTLRVTRESASRSAPCILIVRCYVSTCSLERRLSVLYARPGHRRSPGWLFCLL